MTALITKKIHPTFVMSAVIVKNGTLSQFDSYILQVVWCRRLKSGETYNFYFCSEDKIT